MPGQSTIGECVAVAPATSANLGCAFDCAAIALNLYLKVRAIPLEGGALEISYAGPGADGIPLDSSNLVYRAFRRAGGDSAVQKMGVRLEIENAIPPGFGLGSSAAAIVAGILLGANFGAAKLSDADALQIAAEMEGHPDNVSAAYLGGFAISARADSGEIFSTRAEVPGHLNFIVVVPNFPMPTKVAREILPSNYSRADAIYNLQRTALLSASIFSGRFDFQPEMFRDRMHQHYRAPLVPGMEECLAFSHPDLMGLCISGAGSAVLAVARRSEREIAARLVEMFKRNGLQAEPLILKAENRGVRELSGAGAP